MERKLAAYELNEVFIELHTMVRSAKTMVDTIYSDCFSTPTFDGDTNSYKYERNQMMLHIALDYLFELGKKLDYLLEIGETA